MNDLRGAKLVGKSKDLSHDGLRSRASENIQGNSNARSSVVIFSTASDQPRILAKQSAIFLQAWEIAA
jgi:hypothetical protein